MNWFQKILVQLHLRKSPDQPQPTPTPVVIPPVVSIPTPVLPSPPVTPAPQPTPVTPTPSPEPKPAPKVEPAPPVVSLPPASVGMAVRLKQAKRGGYVSPAYQELLKEFGQDNLNRLINQYSEQGNWGGDPALAPLIRETMLGD